MKLLAAFLLVLLLLGGAMKLAGMSLPIFDYPLGGPFQQPIIEINEQPDLISRDALGRAAPWADPGGADLHRGGLAALVPYAEPVPAYGPMFDAYGIWNAWSGGLYDIPWLEYEAYVYSPAFAQLIYPFTLLPWPVFAALWTGLAIGILFWMRVPWMLAFPGVIDDILRGNIHVFLAGAVVLAVWRQPWGAGAWAFPFLTKVTPGIGILWHPLRGEWRALWVGLGLTAAIVGVSVLLTPDLWAEWISLLAANVGADPRIQVIPLPFLVRLPIAVVLIVVAARWTRPGCCRSG